MTIAIYHAIGISLAYIILRLYHLHMVVKKWLAMQVTYKDYKKIKGGEVNLQGLSEINLSFAKMFDPRYWSMQALLTIKGNENLFFSVCFTESVKPVVEKSKMFAWQNVTRSFKQVYSKEEFNNPPEPIKETVE